MKKISYEEFIAGMEGIIRNGEITVEDTKEAYQLYKETYPDTEEASNAFRTFAEFCLCADFANSTYGIQWEGYLFCLKDYLLFMR